MKVIKIINELYIDNILKFRLGNVETGVLKNDTGVRQGCVISPTLLSIYMKELVIRIRKAGVGVEIGRRKLRVELSGKCIQHCSYSGRQGENDKTTTTSEYGRDREVSFSGSKYKMMEFNTAAAAAGQWVIGSNVVEVVVNG